MNWYDLENIKKLEKAWEMILPTIYNESLSYIQKLEHILDIIKKLIESNIELTDEWLKLKDFIDTQIKEYTEEQLQEWLDDGTFQNFIDNYLEKRDFIDIQTIGAIENEDISDILISCIDKYTTIYIPNKSYKISKKISLKSNVKIVGGLLIIEENASIDRIFDLNNVKDVIFENVTIDNNRVPIFPFYVVKSQVTFNDCHFINMHREVGDVREIAGIYSIDSDLNISRCSFKDYGYLADGQQQVNQMSCVSVNTSTNISKSKINIIETIFDGVWIGIYSGCDTLVENCHFNRCKDNPYYSNTNRTKKVNIIGCVLDELEDEGFVVCGDDVKIQNVTFNKANVGAIVILNNINNLTIKDCYFNNFSTIARCIEYRENPDISVMFFENNIIKLNQDRAPGNDIINLPNVTDLFMLHNYFNIDTNGNAFLVNILKCSTFYFIGNRVINNNSSSCYLTKKHINVISSSNKVSNLIQFIDYIMMNGAEGVVGNTSGNVSFYNENRIFWSDGDNYPSTGLYRVGDLCISKTTGNIYVCTVGGRTGTVQWKQVQFN